MIFIVLFILFFISFTVSNAEVTLLKQSTIYLESFGNVELLPNNCESYCPEGKCTRCNITDISCDSGNYYKLTKSNSTKQFIAGIYATIPSKACVRDTLTIDKPGTYTVVINKLGDYLQFVTSNVANDFDQSTIFVSFTLGYDIQ